MHSTSPRKSPTRALAADALLTIRMTAPPQPIATPPAFIADRGSRRMKNESTMAKMGIDVVTMLALTGEVMPSPMVYMHWLNTMPNSAATASNSTSRRATRSRGAKSDAVQNSSAAPATRSDTRQMPSMPWAMASLPTGAIRPQKISAKSRLRWALSARLSFIILLIVKFRGQR